MREEGIAGKDESRVEEWMMREEGIGGGIDWREEGLEGRRMHE